MVVNKSSSNNKEIDIKRLGLKELEKGRNEVMKGMTEVERGTKEAEKGMLEVERGMIEEKGVKEEVVMIVEAKREEIDRMRVKEDR